jgi:DNA-binding response OmpR family regulator
LFRSGLVGARRLEQSGRVASWSGLVSGAGEVSRVLIIDDEPRMVSLIRRALDADGHSTIGTTEGALGLTLALEGRYELVVLDLLMPGIDGATVLERIMDQRPEQPILVLSALSDVDTKVRCFSLGAVDYLTKPFAVAELRARVRARAKGNGSGNGTARTLLRVGGIRLDLQRRTADAGEGPKPLSNREFLLLKHLMSHAGDVCTREAILADVWGISFDPGTNVVDVYVGRLRSKIGRFTIETVRDGGYALSV